MRRVAATLVVLAACASPPPPEPATPSPSTTASPAPPESDACRDLAGACHAPDKADGGALVHDCHRLGHAHDPAACAARHDECMKACAAPHP